MDNSDLTAVVLIFSAFFLIIRALVEENRSSNAREAAEKEAHEREELEADLLAEVERVWESWGLEHLGPEERGSYMDKIEAEIEAEADRRVAEETAMPGNKEAHVITEEPRDLATMLSLAKTANPDLESQADALIRLIENDSLSRGAASSALRNDETIARALYLECVDAAMEDYALADTEMAGLRVLRLALGIEDGALLEHDPHHVESIVARSIERMLLDFEVTPDEGRLKVELQEVLSISYDDWIEMASGPTGQAVREILDCFVSGEEDPVTGKTVYKLTEAERSVASQRVQRFQAVYDMNLRFASESDEPLTGSETRRSRHISQTVKDRVWNRDGGCCVQCGSNENLEFDHIIPHSKGGANTYRNIQLLCEHCNRVKSDSIGGD